nr:MULTISPECIES: SDR family oxidoreductase [unclassified Rhodococcus (in: high G+C Gram-positive bacteria)]
MSGRVALVTGASKNIGLASAKRFAEAGADLIISSSTDESLQRAATALRTETGRRVVAVVADARDPASMGALAETSLSEFGRVDIVMNNALLVAKSPLQQRVESKSILTAPTDLWDEGFAGYIHGPLALLRPLVPVMEQSGRGSIINVLSTAAFSIVDQFGVYGVTKAAMWSLTQYLAAELAPAIRVNALCPGTISESGEIENEAHRPLLAKVPLGRMGAADECASTALFLASDASAYTTGQVIQVDGGRVALK